MTKHILTYCLIALFLSSCNNGLITSSPRKDFPLLLKLEINSDNPESWQDVEAAFTITNISNEAVSYGFASGCQFGYTVKKNGQIIFDSRKNFGCTAALTSFKLKPGKSKTFSINLTYVGDGVIPEGHYRITAFLLEGQSAKVSKAFKK